MLNPPQTVEEARKVNYSSGGWQHRAYQPERCAYLIWGKRVTAWQCYRKPRHDPAKLYCRQHSKMLRGK